ncbi:acyltransferase [Luteimonas viscosa]|uniref:Acyltransferase n=1 Tax=Luteimonas viscosa TaxID=1132694 RepID=A0A5D4XW82_9GAMM|nr:acyltransferase family protein [Luteimonas viscosa]TYT27130.1 acyltransferase [Luteimonas viscosa]
MDAGKQHSGGGYRPEIDGLRAVAVVSVILYHINKAWLPGGYVGVDIFFVISGFLITSIIWRELQGGSFSLTDFYLRRIRRIIPVMLVVVAATLVAGVFLLLPGALERLALSSIFSVASAANIYFWRYLDDDYFAETSDQEPLLHLWSLGVEEQFYLVWPILLLMIAKNGKHRTAMALLVAIGIAVASFALAEATNESNPKFSYFMLPARAGELMIGALLALGHRSGSSVRWLDAPLVAEIAAAAGLAAIGYSVFFLDDLSPFPGVNAIYPCVGAALVILAGARSRLLRWLLANRAMVWIGLLSYSLYLWHWPILAFIRYFFGTVSVPHAALAVAGILALSVLSYRRVERPARRIAWPATRQVALLLALPAMLVLLPAAHVVKKDGLQKKIESSVAYRKGVQVLEEETAAAFSYNYNCQLSKHVPDILFDPRCVVGAEAPATVETRVLLWGDSHAAHHIGALDLLARHAGISIRNASHSSCPPVFPGDYSYGRFKAGCSAFRPYIREHVRNGEFDVVIFGGAWESYDREPGFRPDLLETIAEVRASGARVVLLGQVPTLGTYNRECDMRWIRLGSANCSELKVRNKGRPINDYLASLATPDGAIAYLDISSAICDEASCPAYLDGKPIYFDRAHLSMRGSWRVGERLVATGQAGEWIRAIAGAEAASSDLSANTYSWQSPQKPSPLDLPAEDAANRQLLKGLALDAPYAVVSDTTSTTQEGDRRKILIEFEQKDARTVGAEIVASMRAAGFRMTGASDVRGGQRFNFRAGEGVKVTVLVLPRGKFNAQKEQATGTVEVIHSWAPDSG